LGRYFLVGGDFNSKNSQWGCISENQRGKMLHSIISKNSIIFISPKGPTYWPLHENKHPSILDFFLSKLPTHINYSISNLCEVRSDHTPVLLAVNNAPKPNIPHTSLSQGSVDWVKFYEIMQNSTNLKLSLKTNNDIENSAQDLISSIQSAVYESSNKLNLKNQPQSYKKVLPTPVAYTAIFNGEGAYI